MTPRIWIDPDFIHCDCFAVLKKGEEWENHKLICKGYINHNRDMVEKAVDEAWEKNQERK